MISDNKFQYIERKLGNLLQPIYLDYENFSEQWQVEVSSDIWITLTTIEQLLDLVILENGYCPEDLKFIVMSVITSFEVDILPKMVHQGLIHDVSSVIKEIKLLCQ